jgi:uncharacterized membrane protein
MRIHLERAKSIGRKIGLNDEKGYVVAIFLALIIISATLLGYYVFFRPPPSGYSSIYILDSQNNAANYPQLIVANQNSTFNTPITVVNKMGWTVQYSVLVQITNNLDSLPVNAQPAEVYNTTLANGQSWQKTASVTENQVGSYFVVFELWLYNPQTGAYQFTHDFCDLPVQVVSQV